MKNKTLKTWCWLSIIIVFLIGIILCIIGFYNSKKTEGIMCTGIGTGLIASAIISLLFYSLQFFEQKEKAQNIREPYINTLLTVVYFIIYYATVHPFYRKKGDVIAFLKKESEFVNVLKTNKKKKLIDVVKLVIERRDFEIVLNKMQRSINVFLQCDAIKIEEYRLVSYIMTDILLIKDGLQNNNFEKIKICYSDLLLLFASLISNTPELQVLNKLIFDGSEFEYNGNYDKLSDGEKMVLRLYINNAKEKES